MDIVDCEESDIEVLELQGGVENMEAFDGVLVKDPVQLVFGTYVLLGRKVEKEFCVLERCVEDNRCYLRIAKRTRNVYLFDKPPRYRRQV